MKRGFTLIELLAVIVILAIIALIAVPIVVNIINDSKKESIKRSAELYIDTVEKRVVKENLEKKYNPHYCEGESGEELTCYDSNNNNLRNINIEIKNKVPKNIKLYFNNGKIIKDETLELEIDGYLISSNSKGEIILKTSKDEGKECILYEDVLDGERLTQSKYVDYTGYTEYTGGMTFADLWQQEGYELLTSTFDSNTKKWTVENKDGRYIGYYIIQEAGYYQITIENGEMEYQMNIQDEEIIQGNNISRIENGSSGIAYLEAGQKIIIDASPGSSYYITKLNIQGLTQSEYVDYTGYTEYTGGMTIADLIQQQGSVLLTSTFDSNTKKWTIEDKDGEYGAYYIIQESGYYQITVENGEMYYKMNIQDEELMQAQAPISSRIENGTTETARLEAGQKIIIDASPGSSYYITKSSTLTNKCSKWVYKYKIGTETISTTKDYRGYYADVDGDGYVDGVIYADLVFDSEVGAQWADENGVYSYGAQTGLKEYTISKEKYTEGKFGKKEIISLKKGSSGTSRFYVMALEDFTTTDYQTFSWYINAYGKMNASDTSTDFGKGYKNTGNIIGIWSKNGIGDGSYQGATQDNQDIWKHIQKKYQEGWYIPSRGEWAAFGDYFTNKTNLDKKLTTSNYLSFGLSDYYWSSSQNDTSTAWNAGFYDGYMNYNYVGNYTYVRLGATF